VLVQLATERTGLHAVFGAKCSARGRNVDSALVGFPSHRSGRAARVRRSSRRASVNRPRRSQTRFALSGLASREHAVEALAAIGRLPSARAEELEPLEFIALTRRLGARPGSGEAEPGDSSSGRSAADGKHEARHRVPAR